MLPSAIGSYRVLREVGRGGMGVVYAARDVRLGRDIAIKVLRGTPSPEETERFRREARLAAQLRHPRIVSVFDVGTHDGSPYIVMPLVEGESLATRRLPRLESRPWRKRHPGAFRSWAGRSCAIPLSCGSSAKTDSTGPHEADSRIPILY